MTVSPLARLGGHGAAPDIIVCDSGDPKALVELVGSTKCVISTVGPFARYGTPLVAACAAFGTDSLGCIRRAIIVHPCKCSIQNH